jgi:dipeptidyl aminopeptidase/acylaminoacyl peptidase
MKKNIILILFSCFLVLSINAQNKRPIQMKDLLSFGRINNFDLSNDGKYAALSITYMNRDENKGLSSIWLYDLSAGSMEKTIFDKKNCSEPRFSKDGKKIVYSSTRENGSQIWIYDIETKSNKKVTNISTAASSPVFSPDGKYIAFISDVYPECPDDECNKNKDNIAETGKVKARLLTTLPYRVWNAWKEGKRSHLFVLSLEDGKYQDLTKGNYDTPPIDLTGSIDFAFSPDSKEICFVRNTDPMVAISTNNDLFTIPVSGGEVKRITENKGNDNQPVYSPDGKYIAFRSMKRAGFEADKYDLMLYNRITGEIKSLTTDLDKSIGEVVWSKDSKSLWFSSLEEVYSNIFKISLDSKCEKIIDKIYATNIELNDNNKNIYYLNQGITFPPELFSSSIEGKNIKNLSNLNSKLLSELALSPLEEFWFEGAGGAKVEGFIIKPPDFNANKKYPGILMIHGGPQGAWSDNWTYRWNAQMFASPGYVVIALNPRGSTGYGQKFCDEISGDWGGKPYEDIMKGLDFALAKYSFIDKNKLSAAGGSYGGYMTNWLLGHTDRFKCLVSHASVYNLTSMHGTTEELWFVEWDQNGAPWANPDLYKKFSPSTYVQNFKTPTLVIHGEQDFRVPISEGMQLFTALQRQGVPSKFLYFPDEGHFVLKPQNSELWYDTVLGWWKEYLK